MDGEDLADFISISYFTGLRISDVATFHIERLLPNGEVKVRATWIPEWLQSRIRLRAERVGPLIFGVHTTADLNVITDGWRKKLQRLWERTVPWASTPRRTASATRL